MRQVSERGASIVEFALVVPLFLLMVLGMIDFGLVLNDNQQLHAATRTAVRDAAVGHLNGDVWCPIEGTSSESDTLRLVCAVKRTMGTDPVDTRVSIRVPNHEEGGSMVVCSMSPTESLTGVIDRLFDGGANRVRIVMRIENAESVSLATFAETPLAGQDWSWCL